ncbi:MAG: GTP-binding protein [Gammaproteobacteria bacterium]
MKPKEQQTTKKPIIITSKKPESNVTSEISQDQHYDYLFKFHLIGDSGVGKSCLLLRYAEGTYTDGYISTIGADFKTKIQNVDGKTVKTQVFDCAGQGFQTILTSKYYQGRPHAVIVAFDLTDRVSFSDVKRWLDAYKEGESVKIILVGTKCDALSKRVVETEEVKEFISESKFNIEAYIETSSKTGEHVQLAFETAIRLELDRVAPAPAPDPRRDSLIADLQEYIGRIESHKTATNEPDFSHGFMFFKSFRAANKEVSYHLAKAFLKKLGTRESIGEIFADIDRQRNEKIDSELNAIIGKAGECATASQGPGPIIKSSTTTQTSSVPSTSKAAAPR